MARRLGGTPEQLGAVATGHYEGVFEDGWRSALRFAEELTPARSVPDDSVYEQLASYWTSAQIVEITCVATLFNYFNRFATALHIPVTR